jgi:nucleotide-binding universal stress UspA family protein
MTASPRFHSDNEVAGTSQTDARQLRPFVVATDGTHESDDAIVLARTLASAARAPLHAITVCDDVRPVSDMPAMFAPVYSVDDPALMRAIRRNRVRDQMLRVLGPGHGAVVAVRSGGVGSAIASYASQQQSELIVTGRGRHGVMDRLLGEEHMLQLLRVTNCPVMMTEPGLQTAPRRVVIGLDFSQRDHAAVEIAKTVITPDAKVFLVHVKPDLPYAVPTSGPWLTSYSDAMRRGLEEWKMELAIAGTHRVETVLLTGHPGKCLADFARRTDADLIAAGIHGLGFFHRLVIGSTMAYLLRSAPCSVLAATQLAPKPPRGTTSI